MCGDGVLGRGGRDGRDAATAPAIRPHQELEGAGSRLSSGSGRTGSASGLRMEEWREARPAASRPSSCCCVTVALGR